MKKKLFGTDGIRAVAGEFPLSPPSIATLGRELIGLLQDRKRAPRILIGRDTRQSGTWMEKALTQGVREAGGQSVSAGVIPTSAVSYLTKTHGFSAGVVLSASHNPFEDNGIKIFAPDGRKIPDDWEDALERGILKGNESHQPDDIEPDPDMTLTEDYIHFLKGRLGAFSPAKRLKAVVDCANGSSSHLAPRIFRELGLEVIPLHDSPDGTNINERCGSLYPQTLAEAVLEARADIGIAYDGDADRAIWADEKGGILNGDHTLYVQAIGMLDAGRLRRKEIVATTMSNMGLEKALGDLGIRLHRTPVGDKYVLDEMIRRDINLGGEQSGHTIFLDDCPTGDGILTSLKMIEAMAIRDASLTSMVKGFQEFPQILVNIRVAHKTDFAAFPEIGETAGAVKTELGGEGRIDIRFSGTEPVARVMVEAPDISLVKKSAERLAAVIRKHLGEDS